MRRLLLVEDDRALSTGLTDAFRLEGFEVTATRDGAKGREFVLAQEFDVVVLDLMLPGRNGLDVLREMRAKRRATPVLILTARGEEADKVIGLELGADDYVTKPFSLRELVARVRALVRRAGARERGADGRDATSSFAPGSSSSSSSSSACFEVGDASVDLAAFTLARGGTTHALSRREAALLALLWERRGKAVSREQILKFAWDGGDHVGTRTIDTHVLNLRQKLESDPANPKWLITVHGVGYRLASDAPDVHDATNP